MPTLPQWHLFLKIYDILTLKFLKKLKKFPLSLSGMAIDADEVKSIFSNSKIQKS
jgi:hypothetical protein